jgi:hypothetical protein
MTLSTSHNEDHDNCTGHVQLTLVGTNIANQLTVTHARIILPEGTTWVPSDTDLDSKETLTTCQLNEWTYLTLEEENNRREAHVILTVKTHPYDWDSNLHMRNLVIDGLDEQEFFVQLVIGYLGYKYPVVSKRMCFDRQPSDLLGHLQQLVEKQVQDNTHMSGGCALPRTYFPLGEPRVRAQ